MVQQAGRGGRPDNSSDLVVKKGGVPKTPKLVALEGQIGRVSRGAVPAAVESTASVSVGTGLAKRINHHFSTQSTVCRGLVRLAPPSIARVGTGPNPKIIRE